MSAPSDTQPNVTLQAGAATASEGALVHRREATPPAKPPKPKATANDALDEPALLEAMLHPVAMHRDVVKDPPVSVNGLLLMACATLLLVLSGFLVIPLPDWIGTSVDSYLGSASVAGLPYSLLLPVTLLVCGVLGTSLGTGAVGVYLVLGFLFMPLFAGGGGLSYLGQPGAGYLMGLLLGGFVCGVTIRWALKEVNPLMHLLKVAAVTLLVVALVDVAGVLGLLTQVAVSNQSFPYLLHWSQTLSLVPLPYDLALGFFALWLVKPLRYLLWLALY